MSASDSAMLQGLTERIERLEGQVAELMEKRAGQGNEPRIVRRPG